MSAIDHDHVAIKTGVAGYPERPPFDPSTAWPELPFKDHVAAEKNPVYDGVRETLHLLGLDDANFGSPEWNPLGEIVKPGNLVVLKPNLVRHRNGAEDHLTALVTHASVIRALLDYVLIALKGEGEVVVGDAPVQETDFDSLLEQTRLGETIDAVRSRLKGVKLGLLDWRKERAIVDRRGGIISHDTLGGDPRGFREVDLQTDSFLTPLAADHEKFRVTNYDCGAMARVHNKEHNKYLISGTVLAADAVINIPKMKPHQKAGITCTLKNNVGINGHKDWLPHHRQGSREDGGDEYEHRSARKRLVSALVNQMDRTRARAIKRFLYYSAQLVRRSSKVVPLKDKHTEGSWHGNDTVWRMVLDLNRVLFYADAEGIIQPTRQRRYLGFVDGVVGGEGNGPLHVTSKHAGLLVAGFNPTPIDVVCAHLMGFDHRRIPLLRTAFSDEAPVIYGRSVDDIRISTDHAPYEKLFELSWPETHGFARPKGWKGHIELPGAPE